MTFDSNKIKNDIPKNVKDLFKEVFRHGFKPILVGGTVRDYFLTEKLGHDWDIELHHDTLSYSKDHWKEFGKALIKFGKVSFLPYEVIRVTLDNVELEFSPPRTEVFHADKNHHSNFDAHFDYKLPFEAAVKRRDFTINAMGFLFHSLDKIELLDPLDGLRHLREKVLHPVGEDFAKDPIRYLRAQRFALKLGLTFTPELSKIMDGMKVEGITPSYLWSEMQKSQDPIKLLNRLIDEKNKHPELKLPLESKVLDLEVVLKDPTHHECWIIALSWLNVNADSWVSYFSVSSESARRLVRWATSSKYFQNVLPETFHGEFEEVREKENFEKLFDWYFTTKQLLQKNPELPLVKMIEDYLPDWSHLYRFEVLKDVKHIDPPFRAKYQVWNLCQRL